MARGRRATRGAIHSDLGQIQVRRTELPGAPRCYDRALNRRRVATPCGRTAAIFPESCAALSSVTRVRIRSLRDCIDADDPLSESVLDYALAYREEDSLLDFKERCDDSEREWLEITKDVMAFVNATGGLLIFGVEDKSFKPVGLTAQTVDLLTNTNNVLQKLNRFMEPDLVAVRTKSCESGGLRFAAWHVPESIDRTHMVGRDG